jgi:superfamily II DNA or RNA helicase
MPIIHPRPHQQSAVINMSTYNRGQVIMPTGSGKTITMIQDAIDSMGSTDQTIVVVAPTIVLSNQLCKEFMEFIDGVSVMCVHSGHTPYFTDTDPRMIHSWNTFTRGHKFIFTTYHSLHRIQQSHIHVDTIYMDESHNSVQRQFFRAVEYFSDHARRCYFFTASPVHSFTPDKPGMNDTSVYGEVICDVPVTEMISGGYIVPPTLHTIQCDNLVDKNYPLDVDINHLIDSIESHQLNNVLVSCKNTTQLFHVSTSQRFRQFANNGRYTIYSISSKYGCFIDKKKVRRETMMSHMRNNCGKFILFHVSILCEGVNVPTLDGIVLLKKLNTTQMVQSIGRVLRLSEGKTEGKVILPLYSRYLKKTENYVTNLLQSVYEKGETPIKSIKR